MSRFEHKAAEGQWRGMSAADRNTFKAVAPKKSAKTLKLSSVLKVALIAILCAGLYNCLGGTAECQPAVRCAD